MLQSGRKVNSQNRKLLTTPTQNVAPPPKLESKTMPYGQSRILEYGGRSEAYPSRERARRAGNGAETPPVTGIDRPKISGTGLAGYGRRMEAYPVPLFMEPIPELLARPPSSLRGETSFNNNVAGIPAITRIPRKSVDPEALAAFNIPWEYDDQDRNYYLIPLYLDEHEQYRLRGLYKALA